MLIALMLACSTRVTVQSAHEGAPVAIVKGRSPEAGVTVATGEGSLTARVPYVVGRRYWAVSGEESTRIPGQAKPAPIVACAAGVLLAWPATVGCLYVSGPTSTPIMLP